MPLPAARGPEALESPLLGFDEGRVIPMTALESVLHGSPEAGEALLSLMSECSDLREFGARCV